MCRNYALDAGSAVEDSWKLSEFDDGVYRLRVYGPNGYFWEFAGSSEDPMVQAQLAPAPRGVESADVELLLTATSAKDGLAISVRDNAYGNADQSLHLTSGGRTSVRVSTSRSHRWYDLSLRVAGSARFERRFAGRIETGAWGFSDPSIGIST